MFRGRSRPAPIDVAKLATAVRAKRGEMTLDEVAEITGVHKSTLSLIENEKMVVSLEMFTRLCNWLGLSMDYFRLPKRGDA
jgi:transcriptional regulator with XRE-family HTH domain